MDGCRDIIFKITFMHKNQPKTEEKIEFFHCETILSSLCSLSSNFLPRQMVVGGTGHTYRGGKKIQATLLQFNFSFGAVK